VEAYSDANAVAFLQTVNTGEIEAAGLAKTKATDAEIKAFARQMETDHQQMKDEVAQTAQRLGLSTTGTDEDVLEDHQEDMRELNEAASGNEFDDKFIDEQVEAHRNALDKIDDAIERTQNAEFRSLLQKARGAVEGHLRRAEQLDKKV
jgi:putative membrane protein